QGDGRIRRGGNRRGSGVRGDDGVLCVRRLEDPRSDRNDDRTGTVVRHADRAIVHDTVPRSAARALVLVAAQCAATSCPPGICVKRRETPPTTAVGGGGCGGYGRIAAATLGRGELVGWPGGRHRSGRQLALQSRDPAELG